jgi:hypothetical protein
VKKVLWDFADNPVTLALLLAAIPIVCRPRFFELSRPGPEERTVIAPRILLVVAITYLVLNLMIVIPVCPPLGRFTDAASLMLAVPLAVWLYRQIDANSRISQVDRGRPS